MIITGLWAKATAVVMIGLYVTKTAAGVAIVLITLTIEHSVVLI